MSAPMIYPFPVVHNRIADSTFIQNDGGFTNEEIDRIREIGDSLEGGRLSVYGRNNGEDIVKAACTVMPVNDDTRWIYERLHQRVMSINDGIFKFDLWGFQEGFSYLRYDAPDGHFTWHTDTGSPTPAPRKLSLVLQLSDPKEYEGGDFQFHSGNGTLATEKQKGIITAFPAWQLHRVTPVTRGTRRALTMFCVGPNFR